MIYPDFIVSMSFLHFCYCPLKAKPKCECDTFLVNWNQWNAESWRTGCNLANVGQGLSKHGLISITGHGSSPAAGLSREPGVCSHLRQTSPSPQWAPSAALLTKRGHAASQHFLKCATSYKPYINMQTQIQKCCSVLKCLCISIV